MSVAAERFYLLCAVALAAIFYVLLRPVSNFLALLAVFFNLVSIAIEASGRLHLISALTVLRGAETLRAFEPSQLHALAYISPKRMVAAFPSASSSSAACASSSDGWSFRSGYFPKVLGVLMLIAGVGYLTDGFALILSPAFHTMISPASLVPAFVAESSLCLWLLVKGVDVAKWKARASAQPAFIASSEPWKWDSSSL